MMLEIKGLQVGTTMYDSKFECGNARAKNYNKSV